MADIYALPTKEEIKIAMFIRKFGFYFEDIERIPEFVNSEYPHLDNKHKQNIITVFEILKKEQDRYFTHRDNEEYLINICRLMGFIKEGERYHKPLPFGLDF